MQNNIQNLMKFNRYQIRLRIKGKMQGKLLQLLILKIMISSVSNMNSEIIVNKMNRAGTEMNKQCQRKLKTEID